VSDLFGTGFCLEKPGDCGKNALMLNKIYLVVLAVFILIMSAFTYYSYGWLASIDNPRTVVANFDYYSNLSGTFLWISALTLLVFANVAFWKTRKLWTFWTTFFYFAVFIVLHTFWLNRSFVEFQRNNGFLVGSYSLSPLFGVGLLIAAAFVVFFDQFAATKMRDKMYPPEKPIEVSVEDSEEKDEPD
jgi:hypothetical protein